jgi:hypothetical protein
MTAKRKAWGNSLPSLDRFFLLIVGNGNVHLSGVSGSANNLLPFTVAPDTAPSTPSPEILN